jgi:predicted nucleic acid-binding protein
MNLTESAGMSNAYFFDTYAFFEIIRGNPSYTKYVEAEVITTLFNLAELNYNLKKEKDKKIADEITDKYKDYCIPVSLEDIKKAMDLKLQHKKLSIPDSIGYTLAKKHDVKFLTGDEGFRDFSNVEFVK